MSLRLKLLLVLLTFAGIVAGVTIVWNLNIAMASTDRQQTRQVATTMNVLEGDIEYLLRKDDFGRMKEKIANILTDESVIDIMLIDGTGKVILASRNILVGEHINDVLPITSEQSRENFHENIATAKLNRAGNVFLSQDGKTISAFSPVLFPGPGLSLIQSNVGALFVQYDLSHSKSEARNRVLIQAGQFSIFALLSSLLVVLSFQLLFGKRMTRLMTVMHAFSVDKVHIDSNIKGTDEIGRLATEFDAMAKAIEISITDAAQLTSDLRDREAVLFAAINAAQDAVVQIDSEGIITHWNRQAAHIFGWSNVEAVGRLLHEMIIPQQYREAHLRGLKHFLATGEGPILDTRIEIEALHRDGHEFPIELSVTPLKIAGKDAFSAFMRDIREVKEQRNEILRLNDSLVEADAVKDDFIEDMNHELRTPLTALVGYVEMMVDDVDAGVEPELASSLKTVQRNALRLLLLVESLMYASGKSSGDVPLVVSTLDVGRLLGDVVTSMKVNADHSGVEVTLRLDSPARDLLIDGDSNQLERVFVNLIHNAIKFTPREGTATIVARRDRTDDDYVEVTVTDTGIGIPLKDFPKVFERFFRASTATEAAIPGFGLGLSLTHSIVSAHHGTITFDSTVDKGTVFTVRLPVKFVPTEPSDQST